MSGKSDSIDEESSSSRMTLREAQRIIDDTLMDRLRALRTDGIDTNEKCRTVLIKVGRLRQALLKHIEKHLINASKADADDDRPRSYEAMDEDYMREYESKKMALENQLSSYVEVLDNLKYQVKERVRWEVETALEWASHDPVHAPAAKHQDDEGYWPACDKIFDQGAEARTYVDRIGKMRV